MSKASKSAWASVTAGLLFLFTVARDIWAPGFLSISSRHPSHSDVTLSAVTGVLFLVSACRGLMRMRTAATR